MLLSNLWLLLKKNVQHMVLNIETEVSKVSKMRFP